MVGIDSDCVGRWEPRVPRVVRPDTPALTAEQRRAYETLTERVGGEMPDLIEQGLKNTPKGRQVLNWVANHPEVTEGVLDRLAPYLPKMLSSASNQTHQAQTMEYGLLGIALDGLIEYAEKHHLGPTQSA